MTRAGIWAAVSLRPQAEKISIQDQLKLGREEAARRGWTVVREFVVPGESRTWLQVQEVLEARRQSRRPHTTFLWTGMLLCAKCGRHLWGHIKTPRRNAIYRYCTIWIKDHTVIGVELWGDEPAGETDLFVA